MSKAMIARGAPFRGIKLDREDFHVLGTPTQACWTVAGESRKIMYVSFRWF